MSLFVRVAVAAAAVIGLCQPVFGQERHKWWTSDTVKAEVGLTDQQSRDLEAIFQAVVPQLRTQKDDLDRLEREVSRLLDEGAADEGLVAQAVDRAEAARGAMFKTRTLMLYRMYRVLSPEQRVKLKSFHQRDRERRPPGPPPAVRPTS